MQTGYDKCVIYSVLLLFTLFLLPAASAGFENCIYCHGSVLPGIPYVNLTSLENGIHGRLNNVNDLNYACYACHWDGTPPVPHAKDRNQIKACKDCHVGNLFNAPPVADHIPDGEDIQTIITCILCHSNSVDPGAGYSTMNEGVAHYGTLANLMTPTIRSTNCTWCHYENSASNAWGTPVDPRVGAALNHALYTENAQCYSCHVYKAAIPAMFHASSLDIGGNRDCISCHDTGGIASKLVDFSATNDPASVHSSLNANSPTSLNRNNLRCWACHGDGDGSENKQPSGGHPLNYKTPKDCSNNNCHSLSQSQFKETMIYSHFKNATLNGNPANAVSYNITTTVQCQVCHSNSLVKKESSSGLVLVSHYGSKDDLVDSFNCIYCHLDKNNSKDWGNATLINKNTTSLIELEKTNNKLTAFEGETIYLGEGYTLHVKEISTERKEAFLQLLTNGRVVDEFSLGIRVPYRYEKEITIDDAILRTPIITLNITSIFRGFEKNFLQFEGSRIRRMHGERENAACYACHLYRQSQEKERYLVIDREYKQNPGNDIIYYARVLADLKGENRTKIYASDENYVFAGIKNVTGRFFPVSGGQKNLKEGETWNISERVLLRLNRVSTDSREAWLRLTIDDRVVEERVLKSGSELTYAPGIRYKQYTEANVTIFTAYIASTAQGTPNFIVLQNVFAISPQIIKVTGNSTLYGYNSSWLRTNDTITSGRIPENLHAPNLYTDQNNWADCVVCHDASRDLRIKGFNASSRLGKHSTLNQGAINTTLLTDPIDKSCWACHTEGMERLSHAPNYILPRNCTSCHTYREEPTFNAINIGDELHGYEPNCESCHIRDSHNIMRFEVNPVIKEAALSKIKEGKKESVQLTAEARGGYKMKIRGAEYFLDNKSESGTGIPLLPVDGTFDSQSEGVASVVDTSRFPAGDHRIYIHAMERNDKWGDYYQVNFTTASDGSLVVASPAPGIIALIMGLLGAYLYVSRKN